MLKAQFFKVKNKSAAVLTGLQLVENVNAKSNQRSTEQYSDIQMTTGFFHVPDLVIQEDDVLHNAFDQPAPIAVGDVHWRVLPLLRPVIEAVPCSQVQVLAVLATLPHVHGLTPDGYQIPGRNNLNNIHNQFDVMLLVHQPQVVPRRCQGVCLVVLGPERNV